MKKRTKIVVVLIISLIVVAGIFLISDKGSLKLIKSRYNIDVRIGSAFDDKMRIKVEKNEFKIGEVVYYDITLKKEFNKDSTILMIVKSKDDKNKVYSKEFKMDNNMLVYPIQPIEITKEGKYTLQTIYEGKVISEKIFEIKK